MHALPDGSVGSMALHVINGAPDEIKVRLLESVDACLRVLPKPSYTFLDDGKAPARVLKPL